MEVFMNKKNDFKLLTLTEEKELNRDELIEYYCKLREYVIARKLTNTTVGATSIAPKLKNVTNKIAMKLTKLICDDNLEYNVTGKENIPTGTILFAHTHQGLLDNFAWIPATPQHCLIFHSVKVRNALLLAQLNTGLILVDKDNKNSRKNAKLDTIKLLIEGHSVSIFPESAYLLSPNKLHLPINYGFLDIAKKTGVPVVPVVDEYTYTSDFKVVKIDIAFCKPIYVSIFDDLSQKLNEYEEEISTKRFELIEKKGVYSRDSINNQEYIDFLKKNKEVLQVGKIDIDVERKNLWGASDEFYDFHHINDIPYDNNNNFLDTREVMRIKRIDENQRLKILTRNIHS